LSTSACHSLSCCDDSERVTVPNLTPIASQMLTSSEQLTPAKSHSRTSTGAFFSHGNGALEELPLNLWNIKEQSSLPEPCVRSHCRFGRCLRKGSSSPCFTSCTAVWGAESIIPLPASTDPIVSGASLSRSSGKKAKPRSCFQYLPY